ncbi:MAG TPA: DUF5916 domain-containing protein [Acidobacteriota bacterium]|jgi:hypothetical protein
MRARTIKLGWLPHLFAAFLLLSGSVHGQESSKARDQSLRTDSKQAEIPADKPDSPKSGAPTAVKLVNGHPTLEIPRISKPPVIDGKLDDDAWQRPPLPLGDWITYNPLYGEKMAQRTEVWAAYDKDYLYFAFHCVDPEPGKIKTTLSRRDNMWNDDWVGLSLDSLGAAQSSYDMFVNPSGIQGDILTTATQGESVSPDWVWDSAGKVTEDGYNVEMRVPLKSVRFKSGKEVRMGVLFWRRVSRLGISASWPDLPPGKPIWGRHATMLLYDLKQPLTLEALPSFTYSINQSRATQNRYEKADSKPDAGLSVKYGITSSVTLDGTINPDFSQVESDSFQVEVNQRYPIFFNEKRPFFMEGAGTFELAGTGGDGNMRTAVHTRRIVDPDFGLKLSGTIGKFTFATLSASDRAPGQPFDDSDVNPYLGRNKDFNIARATYNLGQGRYVGAIVADTEFADGHNRVAGGDFSFQLKKHQFTTTFLGTETRSPDGQTVKNGYSGQATYLFNSKRYFFISQMEHYDKDFQMDTAFYNRTGITTGWSFAAISFYPDNKKYTWFKRFVPFVYSEYGRDRFQRGNEHLELAGARMHFTRQGFFRFDVARGQEPWAGQVFHINFARVMGQAQLTRWLNVSSFNNFARSIFYDPANPFSGNSRFHSLELSFQPNAKLNESVAYNYVRFDRATTGERVYTVKIINTRTTYQLDKHFFLRAILQYDSSRYRALTDFLASYELIPGTVTYVGYGSLIERREYLGNQSILGQGDYLTTRRGLFFKASYLHRF